MKSLTLLSALCGVSSAHFLLKYPKALDFNDDTEDQGPCGGALPDFSKKLPDFHVDGDAVAVKLTHPQGDWLFRVTTDQKAESGWEQIFPIVQQSGLGDFCEPAVTVPSKLAGKKGIVSAVVSAVDGLLYQCVAVNFVEGKASDKPSECTNSTIKASFVDNAKLSALVDSSNNSTGSASSTSGSASSTSGSKTSGSVSTSTPTGAASSLQGWTATGGGWGMAMTGLCMVALGGALFI